MSATPELDEPIDGRTARAVRTRDAIVEACLGLIDEGDLRPTGPRIAERAGVSVRSIFQHFVDLEALFGAVGEMVRVRLEPLLRRIDPAASQDERVEAHVVQRAQVLEALSPVLRAALVHAPTSGVISDQFTGGHAFFRAQVEEVFAAELGAAGDQEAALAQALVIATSWTTWELLRSAQGLAPEEAQRSMAWLVRAALVAADVAA